jgi:hypothetical protein
LVCEVAEKVEISNEATVGVYNFAKGKDFVTAAKAMIAANKHFNNEFYIAPVFNELIASGKRVGAVNIGTVKEAMMGLGTPEDLAVFLENPISKEITKQITKPVQRAS